MYYKSKSILVFITLVMIVSFSGCKKYPENTLWFKNAEKVFKGGRITSYTANGQDLMPYYKNLYSTFPYNYCGQKLDDALSLHFNYDNSNKEISSDLGEGSFKFSKTKKEVAIIFHPVNEDFGAENIFQARLSWKVLKLTKDGQLKIRADYNFKTYEIQFN
ncbi:MAG TPA: hypothetical protein PLC65_16475 [Bacteroidia bacterium]|nr:hypothetical protein [Bacteroidia bacterium]